MRLKYFENFNSSKYDEVIKCIQKGGYITATIVRNFPENDPKIPLNALSIDDDGLITVEYNSKNYEVELKNVETINY